MNRIIYSCFVDMRRCVRVATSLCHWLYAFLCGTRVYGLRNSEIFALSRSELERDKENCWRWTCVAVKNLPIAHRVAVQRNVSRGLHFATLLKSGAGFGASAIIFTRGASANLWFPACAHISGARHDRRAQPSHTEPRPPDDITTTLIHIKHRL